MVSRHKSRHRAVQILYQCDVRKLGPAEGIRGFYDSLYTEENEDPMEEPDRFMEQLVHGTVGEMNGIDERIGRFSANWRLERMSAVDRNILRLAIYEMMQKETPPPVVIDEALELARRFSGDESVPFINGLLDSVRKELGAAQA